MRFEISMEGRPLQEVDLDQDVVTVGRLASSHLRLDHPSVARMHARIERTQGGVTIVDLGAASGTLVNGRRVNKAELKPGDRLQVGEFVLRYGVKARRRSSVPAPTAGSPAALPAFAAPKEAVPAPFGVKPAAASSGASASKRGEARYALRRSGAKVDPIEVEVPEACIEVMVLWGRRSVLHVSHLALDGRFVLGNGARRGDKGTHFILPRDVFGEEHYALVADGGVHIPKDAVGTCNIGKQSQSLAEAAHHGILQPSSVISGAQSLKLEDKTSVRFEQGEFSFVVRRVRAGKRVGATPHVEKKPFYYIGGSALLHLFFLLLFYFVPPSPSALSVDMLNTDLEKLQYLLEAVEEEKQKARWLQGDAGGGDSGQAAAEESGESGKKEAPKTQKRSAVKGPKDNANPTIGREAQREMARNAGVLGALRSMSNLFDGPTSPFGAENALGRESQSAFGGLLGAVGNSGGVGGLGLEGAGSGGGGDGKGTYGVGRLGTVGGKGRGGGRGYGSGKGKLGGREGRGAPKVRSGTAAVKGSLSKEAIRRVVNRHRAEVKFCYERVLNKLPDLEGRVSVKFVISPSGAVISSSVATSSLRNAEVESCIVGKVKTWSFPSPDGGGVVSVTYPFILQQS